jgi:hypothetical protein
MLAISPKIMVFPVPVAIITKELFPSAKPFVIALTAFS